MNTTHYLRDLTAALLLLMAGNALAAETVRLGDLQAKPGETVSGYLSIAALNDVGTELPVSIIHGARPGPTLALIAGIAASPNG